MRERDESVLQEILPPEERAIEAVVARYQRVAPAVTRFARSLSGNDELQVRLGTQAASTPDAIVIDPRTFQTAYARSAPVTPSEVALTSALHEAIHLIATDLDEERPLPKEWLAFMEEEEEGAPEDEEGLMVPIALFQTGEMEEDELRPDIDDENFSEDETEVDPTAVTVLEALNHVGGPAAEALFLAVEDARQERIHFDAYPGAGSVLKDLYRTSVGHAMGQARPLGQFSLAIFLVVGGHEERNDVQKRLDPHVAHALDDAMAFLDPVFDVDDAWSVGTIALQLLSVAKMHNLVQDTSAATMAQKKAANEMDGSSISNTLDAVRLVTPSLADRDSYEQTRQAAQAVSAQDGIKGEADTAGDPATDQLMTVSTAPTVFLPTGQGGKLLVTDFPTSFAAFAPQGREMLQRASADWGVAQHRVSGELYPLFLANQRRGLRSGFDAGDLSPYTPLLLGAGLYERMFERRDLPSRRSYAVSLLVDGSASMLQPRATSGERKAPWAMAAALLGAWTLARLADELQIDFELAIFNRSFVAKPGDTEESYRDMRAKATAGLRQTQGGHAERLTRTVNHYLIKSFAQRWRSAEDILAGLFYTAASPKDAARDARKDPAGTPPVSMFDKAANVDEFNVAHAAERLGAQHATHRIMVVLADGMTRGSVQDLAETVADVEHAGATVLGIGIGDDTVRAAYSRAQVVEQPLQLAQAMVDGVRSTLYRTIVSSGSDAWWAHAGGRAFDEMSLT